MKGKHGEKSLNNSLEIWTIQLFWTMNKVAKTHFYEPEEVMELHRWSIGVTLIPTLLPLANKQTSLLPNPTQTTWNKNKR